MKGEGKPVKQGGTSKGLLLTFSVFTVLFIVAAIGFTVSIIRAVNEERGFKRLRALGDISKVDGNEEKESHAPETFNLPILPQYAAYYKMNPDFAGWLRLKNTKINYPVMLTPDEPEYYLKRAFDRSSSVSGTPFIGVDCNTDSDCIIIHGHNMKNDTLFGTLDYYKDKSFWKNNPTIFFDTLYEKREYAILAVFRTRIFKPGESGFRYYEYGGDLSEAEYNKFIKQVSNLALYNTGVTARYGEPLLVLSTCSYHVDNGRFVVVAKLINQD